MSGIKSLNNRNLIGAGVRPALRVALGLFLLSPFLIWLIRVDVWAWPAPSEWFPVMMTALVQAVLSALFSLAAGFALFLGLQSWLTARQRSAAELALLLPNMIPPLFLVLGLMNMVAVFTLFPYGMTAVIAAHVLLNCGLVAISLDRLVVTRVAGMAETAMLMGVSNFQFWLKIAWPQLKSDIACLFLFVFSICFTSFSIPLLLSGERAVTLEVAIYDAIRIDGRWDKAVLLAAFQSLMLFVLAWLLPRPFWPKLNRHRPLNFLGWKRGRHLVWLPALLLSFGWISGMLNGLGALSDPDILSLFLPALLMTLAISLGVGLLHLKLFLLIAFVSPHHRLDRFLNGYLSPSPVITGFALLLLPVSGELWNVFKIIIALTLISLPLLYRWMVHSALEGLNDQIRVARLLGARWTSILFEVVWPQISVQVLRASGLAALWASGDFALSAILADDLLTIPMMMEELIGHYQMESAQLLMLPLLAIGLGIYFLFNLAGRYVTR